MTIDEAIEVLKDLRDINLNYFNPDRKDALKLGIEALKGITAIRCGAISNVNQPLPGETGK